MMHRSMCAATLVLGALLGVGCNDTTGGPAAGVDMSRYRSFHIVQSSGGDVSTALQNDLGDRGLKVTAGGVATAPPDTDVKITFQDHWMWDMRMFLVWVKMQMVDARTGETIATGKASQVSIGAKPPPVLVKRITDRIFGTPDTTAKN